MVIDLILSRGTVITMDPARRVLEDAAVAIDDGRIHAIGPTSQIEASVDAERIIDCRGKVLLPGLIDTHGHGGHSLIKTIAADTPSLWMPIVTNMYKHDTTDEYWYIDGLLSALERLKFGVTCGVSVIGSQPRSDDPVFGLNHARAYTEVGIREVVAVGPCAPPWPHAFSRWIDGQRVGQAVSFDQALAGAEAVIETMNHGANDRIRVFITPFTIVPSLISNAPTPGDRAVTLRPSDRELSRRIREIAEKYQTRIHSDAFGGMVRLAARDEYGLLGPDVHLQHCFGLMPDEVAILAATGTAVSHAPGPSQSRGRCPVIELMQAGVTVAISTDGSSAKTPFDLFPMMRTTQLVQQLAFGDPLMLPPGKALEMVTIDAACALGWDDEIGSLEVGKRADVIVVNMRQPHLSPPFMPVHRLVYEASGQDVQTVIVDGRLVMDQRRVLTVDEAAILDLVDREAQQHIARAGLQEHMHDPGWGQPRRVYTTPDVLDRALAATDG